MAGDITTIARPYAEAVFERAKESGEFDEWSGALELLAATAADPQLAHHIANPNVPRDRVQDMLLEIGADALSEEARNLVKLLAANNRLVVLPEIARLYDVLRTEQKGVRQVQVRSAYALSASQQKSLASALKKRLGEGVELLVEKDPSLIGGIEIRADDLVIDGSVRGKLEKLATELQI
jgi:F-type H+-transporting ATPase subunit delta